MLWSDPPGQKYRRFNGETYRREDWDKNKSELQKKGKDLRSGIFGCNNYRVVKKGKFYILYTR